jgi:hypothetical protein
MVGAVLVLSITLWSAAAAPASRRRPEPPSCRAGKTVFRHDGIRAFVTAHVFGNPRQAGSTYKTFYVCSPTLRKAHLFDQGAPFVSEGLFDFRIFGDRLGFAYSSQGVQNGSAAGVGWVNLKTGRAKAGSIFESEQIANEEEEDPRLPRVPSDRFQYAIAGDGTVAVLGEGGDPLEWEVAVLPVKPRSLGAPQRLFAVKAPQEGLDVESIAISGASVTWKAKHGLSGSAQR